MSDNPALSVILPVYNAEKYISATLQSILNQSFNDFELIILDDKSTDNSLQILQSFKDPRIRLIQNETNLKLIKTLNKGLGLCRAPIVARCDADDLYHPDRFKKQFEFMQKNQQVGVVGSDAWIIDSNNKIKSTTFNFPLSNEEIQIRLETCSAFFHPAVMFKKELVLSVGGYPSEFLHIEDYALWLMIRKNTTFQNLSEKLIYYRVHTQSISGQNAAAQAAAQERAREAYVAFKKQAPTFLSVRETLWMSRKNPKKLLLTFLISPIKSFAGFLFLSFEVISKVFLLGLKKIQPFDFPKHF